MTPSAARADFPWRWVAAAAALFCAVSYSPAHYWDEYFYLYSVWQHSVRDLIDMEGALADGLFPNGFFTAKLGFVVLLDALVALSGPGEGALLVLRVSFTLLILALGAATWLLVRELPDAPAAWKTAVVALFLPVPLYLGFKLLSEGPSLLLATLGGWQLVRALGSNGPDRAFHIGLAGTAMAVAMLMRQTSALFLAGLVAWLVICRPPAVPLGRLLRDVALVILVQVAVLAIVLVPIVESPLDKFSDLAGSVTSRRPDLLVMLYGPVLAVQFSAVAALAALWPPLSPSTRASLVWMAVAFGPYLLLARYLEPRYFYTATLPLALIVASGLDRLARLATPSRRHLAWVGLLALTVSLNRLVWMPLMPSEIREDLYGSLARHLQSTRPSASFVTPWLSDFCYLSFAFPGERVGLGLSSTFGSGQVFSRAEFRRWLGPYPYVGGVDQLEKLRRPWLYLGWDYSPTVRAIDERLAPLGIRYLDNEARRGQLLNHLTPSWIWSSTAVRLEPAGSVGPYRAFEIVPTQP